MSERSIYRERMAQASAMVLRVGHSARLTERGEPRLTPEAWAELMREIERLYGPMVSGAIADRFQWLAPETRTDFKPGQWRVLILLEAGGTGRQVPRVLEYLRYSSNLTLAEVQAKATSFRRENYPDVEVAIEFTRVVNREGDVP